MASDRWKESRVAEEAPDEAPRHGGPLPDFVRKALTAGFSGFFLTGEALREALGDSVPKEWADFASETSQRARSEFFERLSVEMGRAVEGIDWAAVIATLLEGRTLQVQAEIRLGDREPSGRPTLQVKLRDEPPRDD